MNAKNITDNILCNFYPDSMAYDEPTTETTVVKLIDETEILPFLISLATYMYDYNEEDNVKIVLDYDECEVRITDI